jgi:hypothetical protein
MPIVLTTPAIEQSTYAIAASFTDDAGLTVAPNAGLTWSLYKKVGGVATVVNSRLNVAIASASTVTILLSGADLAIVPGESKTRFVIVQGTYNSTLGTNLPMKQQISFGIVDLVGVL